MMPILVEETDDSEEDGNHDNRKAVLVDDLEDREYEIEDGTAGGLAGWRLKSDLQEGEKYAEEQEEKRKE